MGISRSFRASISSGYKSSVRVMRLKTGLWVLMDALEVEASRGMAAMGCPLLDLRRGVETGLIAIVLEKGIE